MALEKLDLTKVPYLLVHIYIPAIYIYLRLRHRERERGGGSGEEGGGERESERLGGKALKLNLEGFIFINGDNKKAHIQREITRSSCTGE